MNLYYNKGALYSPPYLLEYGKTGYVDTEFLVLDDVFLNCKRCSNLKTGVGRSVYLML